MRELLRTLEGSSTISGMRQPFPPELCLFYPRESLGAASGDGLSNILVDDAPDGALCVVPGQGIYLLEKFSTVAVSSPTVIATGRGAASPGRWVQFSGSASVSSIAAASTFGVGTAGVTFTARFDITAGGGGAPDDVVLLAVTEMPYDAIITDAFMKVTGAGAGASFAQLRSAAGGAGNLFAEWAGDSTSMARNAVNDDNQLVADAPLFLRRSDNGIGGVLYVEFMRV